MSKTPKTGFVHWAWEWVKSIAFALVVWLFLRTFLVEAFRIPSGSMENTLLVGDFLFVNKLLYGAEVPVLHKRLPAVREPRRGDVVIFDSVEEADLKVVKRLVGMPGDTLAMEGGQLIRNGQPLDEPWARHGNPGAYADAFYRAKMRRWQVEYFVGSDPASYNPDLQDWGPIEVPLFFQAEDGIRDLTVTGVQTCALPICRARPRSSRCHPGCGRCGPAPR